MEQIKELAMHLKLSFIKNNIDSAIVEAKQTNQSYENFIINLFGNELETRRENSIKHRIKEAKFTQKKYLEDFKLSRFKKSIQDKLNSLDDLSFINNHENVLLIGNPGMGKTHYAIGLGLKACLEGKKVFYISVPNLVIELKEAMSKTQITQYKKSLKNMI